MRYILPIFLLLLTACDTQSSAVSLDLKGFDWKQKKVITLEPALNEISGIVYDAVSKEYLAINDEEGLLYVLNPSDYKIKQALPFGKKGDYECVSIGAGKIYVLRSDGHLWAMQRDKDKVLDVTKYRYEGNKTEFEATLWDQQAGQLRLISKKSDYDRTEKATHIYTFDPATGQYLADASGLIPWDALSRKGAAIKGFHPSAAAVQPGTGNIFLVSSIEKLLVVCNSSWAIESIHPLDPALFRQPEGITFDDKGNLIITNEAADAHPTLIFIPARH